MADATIEIPITTDASKFVRETARATNGLLALEKAQIAVGAAVEVARSAYDKLISQQVDAIRQIDRLAKSSQLSVQTLGGLRLAAARVGKELEDVVPIDLADRLVDLRDGTTSVVDDFKVIGLTAKDFASVNYDLEKSYRILLNALRDAGPVERAAAATRLLGSNGEVTIAALEGGAEQLDKFSTAAAEVGVTAPEAAEAARELADAMSTLSLVAEQAGAELTAALGEAGALSGVKDFAIGASAAIGAMASSFKSLSDSVRDLGADEVFRVMLLGRAALADPGSGIRALGEAMGAARRSAQGMSAALADGAESLAVIGGTGGESSPVRKVTQALVTQRAALEEVTGAWSAFGPAVAAQLGLELAAVQGFAELERQIRADAVEEEIARLEAAGQARARAREQAIRDAEAIQAAQLAAQLAIVDNAGAAASAIASVSSGASAELRALLTAAAIAERAAAVARTLYQVGPAFAQGVGSAPPPLGPILGGISAGLVVAQAAATAAAPLPKFHRGRAMQAGPDEVPAVLHRTEAVLTAEAVQQLNAGRGGGGSEPAIVVLDHVSVGRAVTRALRDPRSEVYEAVRRDLPGHSRRRR